MSRSPAAHIPARTVLLAASEACLIFVALLAALFAQLGQDVVLTLAYERGLSKLVIASAVCLLCMYYYDLYDWLLVSRPGQVVARLLEVLGASSVVLAILYYVYPVIQLRPDVCLTGIVFVGVSLVTFRKLFQVLAGSPRLADRALVLGDGPLAMSIVNELHGRPQAGVRLLGYALPAGSAGTGAQGWDLPRLGDFSDLEGLVERERINRVVVADGCDPLPVAALLELESQGVVVQHATELQEKFAGRFRVDALRLAWLLLAGAAVLAVRSAEIVFWILLVAVAYTYVLYPVLLLGVYSASQIWSDWRFLGRRRNRRSSSPEDLPHVTLIIPAHDEEARLPQKLANIRETDYPRGRLHVIIVSDGSTDRTNEILAAADDENLTPLFLEERRGKCIAVNRAVAMAETDILVFSDASTLFAPDAIRNMVRHFADPSIGSVCGALQFSASAESRQTEGIYWRYESMLRLMEGRLGATLTASGAIYAIRRCCYRPLPSDAVIDDLLIPMNARRLGMRVLYDPEATATEVAAETVAGEFARRVRLAIGSFRALAAIIRNPWRGFSALAFFSHKLLRWILPFLLLGMLVSSALLATQPFYAMALFAQIAFLLWAGVGYLTRSRPRRPPYALTAYFLVAMNMAFLVGFFRYLGGRKEARWQRVT